MEIRPRRHLCRADKGLAKLEICTEAAIARPPQRLAMELPERNPSRNSQWVVSGTRFAGSFLCGRIFRKLHLHSASSEIGKFRVWRL